ncbi:hypothetical protein V1517DRAFT_266116, partial [Lipomyces orientalis]
CPKVSLYYGEDASNRVRSPPRGAIAIARAQSPLPAKTYKGQMRSQTGAVTTLRLQKSISLLEMATYDDERLSYQRAMDFLTANEPERRLDIHLSYQSFRYLEEKARALYVMNLNDHKRYPRVEYSAIDSRVIIHTIPTALHGASAVGLE